MRTYRLTISAIALLVASIGWYLWAQNRPEGAFAATVPVPGQVPIPVPTPTPAPAQPPAVVRPPTPGAQAQQKPEEQMRIVADPATNSLVIYGTAQEFQNIKTILKDLDLVPRQVLLDVLIVEVTLKEGESLGVDYEILKQNKVTIFGESFGSRGAVRTLNDVLSPAFPKGGQFGQGLSGIVGGSTVQALITALATDSRAKILSSPSVLASDNRPARIQVGSEEPIATGSLATPISTGTGGLVPGTTSSFTTSTTVQYRNTGRIVTIIPQVNAQGLVNLQILAEVSQRGANVQVGQDSFPAFDTRQAETTAVVQDGDTLAIGGIIADNRLRSKSGIPYLMDLPVLGRFFGSTSDTIERTELIMMITPHVIRNRDQGLQITDDFKKSLSGVRNELDRMAREREKLQQIPMQQSPALPGPSGGPVPPPPPAPMAPSAAPAAPQGGAAPLRKINVPSDISPSEDETRVLTPPAVSPQGGAVTAPSVQPAYALSVIRPIEPLRSSPARPLTESRPASKLSRQWAVQVASLAGEKDAQKMAELLRKNGYEAYVTTFETESKTWHRVRVGRFGDLRAANELKSSLSNTTQFKQAYVAAN
jgi:Flp pilus assembly secretin CpaC